MVKQILWGNFKPPTKNSFVLIVKIKKIPIDNKFDFKDIAFFFFCDAIPLASEKQSRSAQITLLMNVVPGCSAGTVISGDSNGNGQSQEPLHHA